MGPAHIFLPSWSLEIRKRTFPYIIFLCLSFIRCKMGILLISA